MPDPGIRDQETEQIARLRKGIVAAGIADIRTGAGPLDSTPAEDFVLLQSAANCTVLGDTLSLDEHAALIPRLIVCPVERGSMNDLVEAFPIAALIEQAALERWARTGKTSSGWSGLVGRRAIVEQIGATVNLIDTNYVMVDGAGGTLPELLIRYLELYEREYLGSDAPDQPG